MSRFACLPLLAALLAVPVHGTRAEPDAPSPPETAVRVGDLAPDFTLKPVRGGQPFRFSEHLGRKPVLLVFWSFFCFPCQRELPALDEFLKGAGSEALTVVGICLDGPKYNDRILPFITQKGVSFPMLHDNETQEYYEAAERYGVVGTPTSFLIDLQGRVRLIHLGRLDPQVLSGALKSARESTYCAEITKPERGSPE